MQNHISITHNLLHKSEPNNQRNLINIKSTGKARSSDNLWLSHPPRTSKLKCSDRSFCNSSNCMWNSLPTNLRSFAQLHLHLPLHPSLTPLPFAPLSVSQSIPLLLYDISLLSFLSSSFFIYRHIFQTVSLSTRYVDKRVSNREYTNTLRFAGAIHSVLFTFTFDFY